MFDEENPVHKSGNRFMFTTEGHIVSLDKRLRVSLWQDTFPEEEKKTEKIKRNELKANNSISNVSINKQCNVWCLYNGVWQRTYSNV